MGARQHYCNHHGWLFCEPKHYQAAFDEQIHAQADKLQSQADAVVQELERTLADLGAKADALMVERDHILSFLDADE